MVFLQAVVLAHDQEAGVVHKPKVDSAPLLLQCVNYYNDDCLEFNDEDEFECTRGKSNQSKKKRKLSLRDKSGDITIDFESMHKENIKLKTRAYE
jgi:hypothetical protein